ncbi:glycosyl hydrolase family 28-related protein [Streptomyces sp. NPDC042319]|uniref:glycosyl hydrolase family 28-related protein n=1 Tax=Streptomyces sp. NPDC042319 TaxID=3154332 RepID=UPI0033C36418
MDISRRTLLGSATAAAAAAALPALPASAASVVSAAAGADRRSALWDEYTARPFRHPQIPYVGRAGSRRGPRAAGAEPVIDAVRDHGATPDGSKDSAPALNRAIEAAGRRGGGIVSLPPGTFRIDDVIRIGRDGVVLRGAGSGRTKLLATKHLTELIGPYGSRYGGDKSAWSWTGGLVWLCPTARYDSLVAAIRRKDWPFEGWTGNRRDEWRTLTAVRPARRGDWSVTVADTARLRPGTLVLLRLADDRDHTLLQHMAGGGPGPAAYRWDGRAKLNSFVPYEWPVRIVRIKGREVTFERPLPLDVRPEWDPRLTTHVPALTGAGVEGLTIEAVETPQSPHLHDKGYNGVVLQCAYDCWVRDVVARHVDNGIGLTASSSCTVSNTRVAGRGSHHPYYCREGAHDNLFEDFVIERRTVPARPDTILHGINVENLSSYNVWSRGRMEMGTFDSHRGLPFANVRTDITIDNTGEHGGDLRAGPLFGARFTHWNIRVTNGRAGMVKIDGLAPYSVTAGISRVREFGQIDKPDFTGDLHSRLTDYGRPGAVRPRNLYEAQRRLRP